MKGTGPTPALSFWFGLGPGVEEMRQNRVWVGPAGNLLNSLLYKEGLDRSDLFLTNMRRTPVHPGDGGPLIEVDQLEFEILKAEPMVMVPMGREATQWLLGDVDMEAVHGIPWRTPRWRWDELEVGCGPPSVVVPMYNPAFALHDAEAHTLVAHDVKQVARVLKGQVAPREMRDEYPNPRYSIGFVPYFHKTVYVDTEGWVKAPWCLTYACIPGKAHMIRATDRRGLAEFNMWLARRERVVLHSAMYDLPVLRAMRVHVADRQLMDTKVMAYVTAIEPQGLKALGFRHACMTMQSYTDLTKPYDFVQAFEYLETVAAEDWGKPDPIFEMKAGKPYVKRPQGLNTRLKSIFTTAAKGQDEPEESDEDADVTGGVDPRKRWFKIDPEIRKPAEDRFGVMPEFSLSLLPTNDVLHYACRDADATCRIMGPLLDLVTSGGHKEVYDTDMGALPMVERMQANGLRVRPGYFENLYDFFTVEMDKTRKQIEVYNLRKYINPGSSDQTATLLFGRLRLPVSKLTKGRKASTADKVLEALRGRHPAVGLICNWRELATLRDKFAKQLPRFVDADGRVRGNIRDTTVVSGRYSMTEPNLMAIPVRTKIGKKIREGFIASEGCVLAAADFDQIELRVIADYSRDESMIKAFNEGRDIHAETASLMFGVKLENVDPVLHRYPAKRIGFGVVTGITELGLYDQMRLAGIHKYSVADCADIIRTYFKVRPGIPKFLAECRAEVARNGYVRDRGGRIRYLPGVYSNHPGIREEALRQSHSHKVSGTAQWVKKRAISRIWGQIRNLPRLEVEPLLEIHDEYLFEIKAGRREWLESLLLREMAADSPLFRVPIRAKVNFGSNWGVLKD